ncbi:MAG: tetratricopeptide repeat protein [Candidatus Dadabacteria bacterium]|nr:tetratricopeptide repeat protein [Candidatus Dadabacteria bacterium]
MKHFLLFIIISFLVSTHSTSVLSKENINKLYEDGRESFLKFNDEGFKEAIKNYKKIIDSNPDYTKAYSGLAETYSFIGYFNKEAKNEYENDFNLSYKYINKAISLDPENKDVLRAITYLHLNLNRPNDALNIARKLLQKEPENHEYLFLYWAADGKKPEDNKINRVLDSNPDFVIAHLELAKSYYRRRGNAAMAIHHLKKAIDVSDSPISRNMLGKVYRSKSLVYESIEEFNKALEMNPSYTQARVNKGISLFYIQRYNESIKALVINEKLNERFPETYYFLGSNYSKLGNREKSIAFYKKFIKITKGQSKYNYYINEAKNNLAYLNQS